MKSKTFFITGIDTNIGKSIATGWMAKYLLDKNIRVITQKLIQTGCHRFSEDIEIHRQLMGISFQEPDLEEITCPYLFSYPCSPHLAAEIDQQEIDPGFIKTCTQKLESEYQIVLLEGAGGIMVPITRKLLTIDYIEQNKYPVILVTSSRLGSLNHTLLTLEACFVRNIEVAGIVYNRFQESDKQISDDFIQTIQEYLNRVNKKIPFATMNDLANGMNVDFGNIFNKSKYFTSILSVR